MSWMIGLNEIGLFLSVGAAAESTPVALTAPAIG